MCCAGHALIVPRKLCARCVVELHHARRAGRQRRASDLCPQHPLNPVRWSHARIHAAPVRTGRPCCSSSTARATPPRRQGWHAPVSCLLPAAAERVAHLPARLRAARQGTQNPAELCSRPCADDAQATALALGNTHSAALLVPRDGSDGNHDLYTFGRGAHGQAAGGVLACVTAAPRSPACMPACGRAHRQAAQPYGMHAHMRADWQAGARAHRFRRLVVYAALLAARRVLKHPGGSAPNGPGGRMPSRLPWRAGARRLHGPDKPQAP